MLMQKSKHGRSNAKIVLIFTLTQKFFAYFFTKK